MSLALAPRHLALLGAAFPVEPGAGERLLAWSSLLATWSRAQRLVGWRTADELAERGLLPVWRLAPLLDRPALAGATLVDVGSGAGLPGLVLAVAFPGRPTLLVEARRKRAAFLREAVRALRLDAVTVHHGRSDAFRHLCAGRDPLLVTSRAFAAPADVLAEAAAWNATHCLVGSSAARVAEAAAWPPAGWRRAPGNSFRAETASWDELLERAPA